MTYNYNYTRLAASSSSSSSSSPPPRPAPPRLLHSALLWPFFGLGFAGQFHKLLRAVCLPIRSNGKPAHLRGICGMRPQATTRP